jgi:hypothetical protein
MATIMVDQRVARVADLVSCGLSAKVHKLMLNLVLWQGKAVVISVTNCRIYVY